MMTCKEVSTRLLRDETAGARIAIQMHLLFCRHCRAFSRQLQLLWNGARWMASGFEAEPAEDVASRLVSRVSGGTPRRHEEP